MKKKLTILLLIIGFMMPLFSYAEKIDYGKATDYLSKVGEKSGTSGGGDLTSYVGGGIQAALGLVGIVFFVLIFYGGIRWFTSRGEEAAVETARNTVIAATIGLLIILGSYALTDLVTSRLVQGETPESSEVNNGAVKPETPVGDIGCCIDATRDTPFGMVYTAYTTDMDTCESQQGLDQVSGANGKYWAWYSSGSNLDKCAEIMETCYDIGVDVDRPIDCANDILTGD
jgi:hypothetical protein